MHVPCLWWRLLGTRRTPKGWLTGEFNARPTQQGHTSAAFPRSSSDCTLARLSHGDSSSTFCAFCRVAHGATLTDKNTTPFHFSRQNDKTKPRLSANSSPQQLPEPLVKLSNNAMLLLSYGVPIAFLSGTRRHNVTVAAPCPAAAPPSPAWRACSASWQSPLWTKSHAALVCAGRTTDKAVWGAARAQEAHG